MKNFLLLLAVALLAAYVVLGAMSEDSTAPRPPVDPDGPWFEVRVVKPRSARPMGGILPDGVFGSPPAAVYFDLTSPGAEVVAVDANRIEFSADGWELSIEIDGEGRVTPESRLLVPMDLGRQLDLRCQPVDGAPGYAKVFPSAESAGFDGEFQVEFAVCDDANSGRRVDWPAQPLSVRGSFMKLVGGDQ